MSRNVKRKEYAIILAIAALSQAFVLAGDEVADRFGLDGRGEGMPLNGIQTEKGGLEWNASPNLRFTAKSGTQCITVENVNPFFANVPILTESKTLSVSCEMHIEGGANTETEWISIGMGTDSPAGNWLTWGKGIFLFLAPSGEYQICGKQDKSAASPGAIRIIKKGIAPEFSIEGFNRLKLTYNKSEASISAWVNDVPVIENYDLSYNGICPEISAVGITGFGQRPNAAAIRNFSLSTK